MNISLQSRPSATRRPLTRLLSRLPNWAPPALFVTALNLTLRQKLPPEVYRQLLGRGVEIVVIDLNIRLCFKATFLGFVGLRHAEPIEMTIRATARDFAILASGDEDADSLYFNRRLAVEGDTELALLVKNTLDALEPGKAHAAVRRIHHVLHALSLNT